MGNNIDRHVREKDLKCAWWRSARIESRRNVHPNLWLLHESAGIGRRLQACHGQALANLVGVLLPNGTSRPKQKLTFDQEKDS
jgi:hypothetical protein